MRLLLSKNERKPANRYVFAWRPLIAIGKDNKKYIVWLEEVWRGVSLNLITYYLRDAERIDGLGYFEDEWEE